MLSQLKTLKASAEKTRLWVLWTFHFHCSRRLTSLKEVLRNAFLRKETPGALYGRSSEKLLPVEFAPSPLASKPMAASMGRPDRNRKPVVTSKPLGRKYTM